MLSTGDALISNQSVKWRQTALSNQKVISPVYYLA
jgi:hypothetical protein